MTGHRLLVIEDQEDLAELYEKTLKKAGYQVTNAYTGEEGVAEFEADGADAILLDMTLPEMHGLQTLRQIRQTSPTVPVLVVTGETSAETRAQCESLGVRGYLAKPVAYDELLAAFARILAQPAEEEYQVVTLRLPARVIRHLSEIDSNLERAVSILCNCEETDVQPKSAAMNGD
jgi:DNA-binding response OmpR family regulator